MFHSIAWLRQGGVPIRDTIRSSCAMTLASLILMGCGVGDSPEIGAFQVTDSAGVEIVRSTSPRLSGNEEWTVSPQAVLQIGQLEGEAPYQFSYIWDATRASDGRIVLVNADDREIRVFSPDGEFLNSFGGEGGGPGEFQGLPRVKMALGDTVLAVAPTAFRLSRFGLNGELFDQASFRSTSEELSLGRVTNREGLYLAIDGSLLYASDVFGRSSPGLNQMDRRVVAIRPAAQSFYDFGTRVGRQLYSVQKARGSFGFPNPFSPRAHMALGSGISPVAISHETLWEVKLFSPDGRLDRVLRAGVQRAEVSETHWEKLREGIPELSRGLTLSVGELEEAYEDLPVADSIPAIGGLISDEVGNLWVGRRVGFLDEKTSEYDVFDSTGRWTTTVLLPDEIDEVFEIGDDYILARYLDEFDVHYLRVYQIVK